jgi:hypothetical protein
MTRAEDRLISRVTKEHRWAVLLTRLLVLQRYILLCQPYAPAAFYSQKDSWYSFLLEAESTPGP